MEDRRYLMQDGQHGAIGLSCPGRCADEDVLGSVECRVTNPALYAIQ